MIANGNDQRGSAVVQPANGLAPSVGAQEQPDSHQHLSD